MSMISGVTGVILAGGKSGRMGLDKAFLPVDTRPLIDYVYRTCRALFAEILIISNHPDRYGDFDVKVFVDEVPNSASLGGLYTGLLHSTSEYVFCVACDMPFLRPELIRYLGTLRTDYDAVIPRTAKGLECLHAFYAKTCLDPISKQLSDRDLRIRAFLPHVRVRYCDSSELEPFDSTLFSFTNINTPDDFRKAELLLRNDGCQYPKQVRVH